VVGVILHFAFCSNVINMSTVLISFLDDILALKLIEKDYIHDERDIALETLIQAWELPFTGRRLNRDGDALALFEKT
jgi:hypothetical protein